MSQFGKFREESREDFSKALKSELEWYHLELLQRRKEIANACESPIELKLADALLLYALDDPCFWRMGERGHEFLGRSSNQTEVALQYKIGSCYHDKAYRVDFAIVHRHPHGSVSRYVIECDGHNYHERTKAQAARDRQKDRDLQSLGWRILRFTGSEIHKDAHDCARQIIEQIGDDGADDFMRAKHEGRL